MANGEDTYTRRLSRAIDLAYEAYTPGDPECEDRLYGAFRAQSRNVAAYHGLSWTELFLADDIATRAMLALPTFRGESRVSSWFYGIAQNEIRRALRTLIHNRTRHVSIDVEPELDEMSLLELEAKPINHDAAIEMEKVQQQLPPEQAEVLALQLEGNTMEEIAERTGTPLGTVRSRNRLAKAKARRRREKERGGDIERRF